MKQNIQVACVAEFSATESVMLQSNQVGHWHGHCSCTSDDDELWRISMFFQGSRDDHEDYDGPDQLSPTASPPHTLGGCSIQAEMNFAGVFVLAFVLTSTRGNYRSTLCRSRSCI